MTILDWNSAPVEVLNPLASRQVLHTSRVTIARLALKKGAIVPEHHHENEQVTTLESGRLKFLSGVGEWTVEAGQSLVIPPNVPHRVEALEDSVAIDTFAPVREDWLRGDDAYLRQGAGAESPTAR
jgi:quercetin dioxygenase-like cupin family protein